MSSREVALLYNGEEVSYDWYERKEIERGSGWKVEWGIDRHLTSGANGDPVDGVRIYDIYENIEEERDIGGRKGNPFYLSGGTLFTVKDEEEYSEERGGGGVIQWLLRKL